MSKPKHQEKAKMSEIDDQILKIFDIKKRLGKGAYGIVWKALDKKTSQTVAVKKIFDAFRNETDAQRTFREITFLREFRAHDNIIQLYSIHRAANHMDIYLSFEFMESDLHNVIKRGTILKDVHKRFVMYQLFNATKYIHSGNVIHRDLKPSNVLIDSRCRCKIADFGLARSVSQRVKHERDESGDVIEPILTDYVATRWYRAPEILVASKNYTKGIDLWSLGCILAEMIKGKPLFPGSCTVNQVEMIISALPEITDRDIKSVGAGFGSVLLNQNLSTSKNIKLEDLLASSPDDGKNLVKSLLVLDPTQRLTAKQALEHKYVEKFRNTLPEPELSYDIIPPFRDDVQLSVQEYRSKLYELISSAEKNNNNSDNVSNNNNINNHVKEGGGKPTMKKKDLKYDSDNKNTLTKNNKSKQISELNSSTASATIINNKLKNESLSKKYVKKNNSTPNLSRAPTSSTTNVTTVTINSNPSKSLLSVAKPTTLNSTSTISGNNNTSDKLRQMRKIKYPPPNINSSTFTALDSTSSLSNMLSSSVMSTASATKISTTLKPKETTSQLDNNTRLLRRGSLESSCDTTTSSTGLIKNGYTKYVDVQNANKLNNMSSDSNYYSANSGGSGKNKYSSNGSRGSVGLKQCRHRSLEIDDNPIPNYTQTRKYSYPLPRQSSVDDRTSTHLKNLKNSYASQVLSTNDLISQMYYENRFKNLEDKIRKHKTDVNTYVQQKQNQKVMNKHVKPTDDNQHRTVIGNKGIPPTTYINHSDTKFTKNISKKYDTIGSNKSNVGGSGGQQHHHHYHHRSATADHRHKDISCDDHHHHHHNGDKINNNYKFSRRASNYGVISASDLYKLRSSEMIL